MPGQLVHFEIPADDTAKAREFWGALFGWQFEAFGGPVDYHLTQISETTGGAITAMESGRRGPRAYFEVDETGAGAARVRELGGEASEPLPVPGMGWFTTCADTQGNEFGLWQTDPSASVPAS
jgi:predicted enzyme related to lactoylglutathione lyase